MKVTLISSIVSCSIFFAIPCAAQSKSEFLCVSRYSASCSESRCEPPKINIATNFILDLQTGLIKKKSHTEKIFEIQYIVRSNNNLVKDYLIPDSFDNGGIQYRITLNSINLSESAFTFIENELHIGGKMYFSVGQCIPYSSGKPW